MIHAIQIPQDEERPLYKVAIENLAGMQAAVGGYIEIIDLGPLMASLIINEEGKLEKLPINRRATLLFWLLFPSIRHRDAIVGDVLIVGHPDKDGNTTDAPANVVELLFETKSYKAEFQTFDHPTKFNGNLRRFDDYFEAANYALLKAQAWTAVEQTRVVPAGDEVA
ncbi:hypothetical protein AHiyo8_58800 [Arthrobacter sp. Hiyo8]|nr:hypothetical protein AHiyo8_58800 [Arthrobacter sp. Hiyo8]GAP57936.1 hypothetical protein AHiyo1_08980 [Arthrobacter sp. Hiyo1]